MTRIGFIRHGFAGAVFSDACKAGRPDGKSREHAHRRGLPQDGARKRSTIRPSDISMARPSRRGGQRRGPRYSAQVRPPVGQAAIPHSNYQAGRAERRSFSKRHTVSGKGPS